MMNNVNLIGRVARDIELKKTQSGTPVATIVIAVDRNFTTNGKRETDFINIEVWNKVAEYCANNIEKGRLISVEGSLRANKYETNDGKKRVNVFVRVERLTTLEKPRKNIKEEIPLVKDENPFSDINESSLNIEDMNASQDYLTDDDIPF